MRGSALKRLRLLSQWIDQGAPWPEETAASKQSTRDALDHWAFKPVRAPAVPPVKNSAWLRNPIDNFVLAKLESKGWTPSPAAEPRVLLRRLYLDVIGMPPSLAEQEAFLQSPTPDALDHVVSDLLTRPGYGERWARHWLDLVRYAETNGYERDATKPHVWRYRDYVIRSLNDDKPFDRFILEQLAGDELPDANAETLTATGFYRLGPWDDEPADPKEDRYDQLDDIREHHVSGLSRPYPRLCALPRSQVRASNSDRLLPHACDFQRTPAASKG